MLSLLFSALIIISNRISFANSLQSPHYEQHTIQPNLPSKTHRRSLLPQHVLQFETNLTFQIIKIDLTIDFLSIVSTVENKLNDYFNTTYNNAYNLSLTKFNVNSDTIISTLYTNSIITSQNITSTQLYINTSISNQNYKCIIIAYSAATNSGNISSNELLLELLIIVFSIIAICIFIGIFMWRWQKREYGGKGEAFLVDDYVKDYKPKTDINGQSDFPTIDIGDDDEKKGNTEKLTDDISNGNITQIEMTEVGKNQKEKEKQEKEEEYDKVKVNEDYGNDEDPEIGDDEDSVEEDPLEDEQGTDKEEHDEDDEKAEEIRVERGITLTANGEELIIEEDD